MNVVAARQSAVGLVCGLVLSACDIGLGGGVLVVNKTDVPLFIDGYELTPEDGSWNYGMSDCSTSDLKILDEAGDEYARIGVPWCEGEIWTINGRDDVSVTSKDR